MEAINTSGTIPNVHSAWQTFVETKCIEATNASLQTYSARMELLLSNKFPCDNDEIRKGHNDALEECQRRFMAETAGMSTNTTEKHLRLLKVNKIYNNSYHDCTSLIGTYDHCAS